MLKTIDEVKSARLVKDPEEIYEIIRKGADPADVALDDDGVVVYKRIGALAPNTRSRGKAAVTGPGRPSPATLHSLAKARGIKFEDEDVDRVFPWWASDERVDSHGDVIRQAGWRFNRFERNPVLLFGHNSFDDPIGTMLDWRIEDRKAADYAGPGLWLLAYIARGDDLSDRIARKVDSGIIRTGSVGFRPIEIVFIEDEEERKAAGAGPKGVILWEQELVEYSVVSIPANDGAEVIRTLEAAKADGVLTGQKDIEDLAELSRREFARRDDSAGWKDADASWRGVSKSLFGTSWKTHRDMKQPLIERESSVGFGEPPKPTSMDMLARGMDSLRVALGTLMADVAEIKDTLAEAGGQCGHPEEGPGDRGHESDEDDYLGDLI